jgi:hypothetical protein
MTVEEAIKLRHAVRSYSDSPIPADIVSELNEEIESCNKESGFHIQLITNEEKTFGGIMAKYGKFYNVKNYIALVGPDDESFDEKSGYYGERIALKAQQLGLNTCWVAMSFSKSKCAAVKAKGEKLGCVISVGFGATEGVQHKSKNITQVSNYTDSMPEWFKKGMDAALLAPTAINQQKFMITLNGNKVKAESTGGPYSKVDLGIVKYNFELSAGKENFEWA